MCSSCLLLPVRTSALGHTNNHNRTTLTVTTPSSFSALKLLGALIPPFSCTIEFLHAGPDSKRTLTGPPRPSSQRPGTRTALQTRNSRTNSGESSSKQTICFLLLLPADGPFAEGDTDVLIRSVVIDRLESKAEKLHKEANGYAKSLRGK